MSELSILQAAYDLEHPKDLNKPIGFDGVPIRKEGQGEARIPNYGLPPILLKGGWQGRYTYCGTPDSGKIIHIGSRHPVEGESLPDQALTSKYQRAILNKLYDLKPNAIVTESIVGDREFQGSEFARDNVDAIRVLFHNYGKEYVHPVTQSYQDSLLYRYGADIIYAVLNDVKLIGALSEGNFKRVYPDGQHSDIEALSKNYSINVLRERDAETISFNYKLAHPKENVVLIFGAAHTFVGRSAPAEGAIPSIVKIFIPHLLYKGGK